MVRNMKHNVDLTANRIFSSDNRISNNLINNLLKITTKGYYPWNLELNINIPTEDEDDMDHQKKSIIALGNKSKREKIRELRHMDSLNYCDCCGERMNKKPWDKENGVCHECNGYYEKEKDRCLWRARIVIRNANIISF